VERILHGVGAVTRSLILYSPETKIPHPILCDFRVQLSELQQSTPVSRERREDQCWCPLLGGVAGFSSARAAGVVCASGFVVGFSHSHDLGLCSCEAPFLLWAACPRSMAGIMAAMQPERSSAQVIAPTERSSLCVFMVGMCCYWVRDFIELISGSSQITTNRKSRARG
jgi:hypothetical protein